MNRSKSWTAFVLSLGLVGIACQGQSAQPAEEAPMNEPAANTPAEAQQLTGEELASALHNADVFLLDVREPDELEELGTVEGYTNIPIGELDGRLDELPRDRPILTA
jgi:hypothetical protein